YNATTHSRINSSDIVNTAGSKAVSAVNRNGVTAVKASAGCVWRPRVNKIDQISKDNRFSWVFFLATKDETSKVLKPFITAIENQINKKVKVIRCDNGTEFKNKDLDEFYEIKGIKSMFTLLVHSCEHLCSYGSTNVLVCKKDLQGLRSRFLQNKPNVAGTGPNWLFDIDSLIKFMIYIPVYIGNQTDKNAGPQDTNRNACTQDNVDTGKGVSDQHHIVLPLWSSISSTYKSLDDKVVDDKPKYDIGSKNAMKPVNKEDQAYKDALDRLMSQEKEASDATDSLSKEFKQGCMDQRGAAKAGSTNSFSIVSNPVNVVSTSGTFSAGGPSSPHTDAFILDDTLLHVDQDDSQVLDIEDTAELNSTSIFTSAYDGDLDTFTSLVQSVGVEADFNNMESSTVLSPIPTHRVHIDHPKDQILGDPKSAAQTRGMAKKSFGV
nr:ribonuclease H-like domain-containing protein [Tanacetum cinerariifolium]